MRVIGGTAKRRQLTVPDIDGLRPTSDRVREAMFDILASRGALQGASVLDAFAGSGALGIEALSRGAASVCFVESERRALAAIKANLVATGFDGAPEVVVVRSDVSAFLGETSTHYDLAFVDPPYAFGAWAALLAVLRCDLAVLESSRPVDVGASFAVLREYRYGGTLVTLVGARGSDHDEPRSTEKDPD